MISSDWQKSSYSGGTNNDCVEVRLTSKGVEMRDSKDPEGGAFRLPASGWRGLLSAVKLDGSTRGNSQ